MKVNKQVFLGVLIVFVVTAIAFLPVLGGEFLNWDDNVLFQENPNFRGFSSEHIKWMSTTFSYGHWQPVSWFSYALDYWLWGMNPHGWHVANWLLHSINGALVFLLCVWFLKTPVSCTRLWAAGLAALFYSLHPLRGEPATWLATRGYLLGGMFSLLTVLFYLKHTERGRYPFVALLFFTLAALTKGICMMLPAVLLLLDWMPLGRITSFWKALVCGVEKIPFFLLSLLTGGMAFLAKQNAGGMAEVNYYGLSERIVQAVYGAWFYVFKGIFPQQLSPLYCQGPDLFQMILSFGLTTLVAVLFFLFRRRLRPVLVVAASAFLLIFPMLGITQSGVQLFADRFTYLAAVPFSVLIAFLLSEAVRFRRVIFSAVAVLIILFGVQSAMWCRSWQDNLTLWERALAVDPSSPHAYNNAGMAWKQNGQYQRAIDYFSKAIRLNPGFVQAWHNRSVALAIIGEYDAALKGWKVALSLPFISQYDRERMLWIRGWVLEQGGDAELALADYSEVIDDVRTSPDLRSSALLLRANLYFSMGRISQALEDVERVLLLPDPFSTRHAEAKSLVEKLNR